MPQIDFALVLTVVKWFAYAALAVYIVVAVGLSMLAARLGMRGGWMAWIPVLNLVLLCRMARSSIAWVLPALIPLVGLAVLAYLGARTILGWYAFELAELVNLILPSKKDSVLFRLVNEGQIIERAWLQPIWGWGRWGRAFIGREGGLAVLTPDSLWIGALGQHGFIGLFAILGVLFLPPFLFTLRAPPQEWLTKFAPVTACVAVLLVFAFDSMVNAMLLPAYMLAAGGVVGWFITFNRAGVNS